jgi:hypothetical protein
MAFPWKMLLGPALLMGLKAAKIDYEVPRNLVVIRILYAVAQLAIFASLAVIYQRISRDGDEKKSVKVKVPSATGGPVEEKLMTHKDYDMSELQKLAQSFGMRAAMTVGIHVYMAVVPALLLQMVSEPVTLYDHALFALYILKKDPTKDDKLKRPFPVDSPMAKFEAMKKELAVEDESQGKKKDDDDSEPTSVIEDTANTTGSQPLSRAERRPRRVESADVSEE